MTLLSESARDLLELPADSQGRPLADLDLPRGCSSCCSAGTTCTTPCSWWPAGCWCSTATGSCSDGRPAGTVTTLRDRTELLAMQSELHARESVTETLRAQTHEFGNQLHTISGLLELEEYDEVGRLDRHGSPAPRGDQRLRAPRVDDPAVAALLVAKTSLAAERRVELALERRTARCRASTRTCPPTSAPCSATSSTTRSTRVGAARRRARGSTYASPTDGRASPSVQVADSGAGRPGGAGSTTIFDRGFSTKPSDASGRGVGLALVQVVCERRGGSVSVHNDGGAVFTARLPVADRGPG